MELVSKCRHLDEFVLCFLPLFNSMSQRGKFSSSLKNEKKTSFFCHVDTLRIYMKGKTLET